MATLIRSDLEFILAQIAIAEAHAAGGDLATLVPNAFAPVGLRTVDGSYNSLLPGGENTGAVDQPFPHLVPASPMYPVGQSAIDPEPRIISNLIADMTSNNPAAVSAFVEAGFGTIREEDGALLDLEGNEIPPGTLLSVPNVAPDVGLSAPFNSWFTFFGQFFDHGLDLVNKSSTEMVLIPLQPDDPLYVDGSPLNFMAVSRVALDANGNATNATTPFVDQNQTYTSHPSHQVFLREYVLDADGHPVATGNLLNGPDGGLPTWADVKAQALNILGIELDDADVLDLPLIVTDPYGNFIPDPETGFPQVVTDTDPVLLTESGTPGDPVDGSLGARTGHAFLNDIAHSATPGSGLTPDDDDVINGPGPRPAGTYDDELLDRHYITGDGRGNENIALTAVHHVFHSEHNRQIEAIKATVLATEDPEFIASWQLDDGSWNGERLFQAARFATEMQYQHLVFEEFGRKLQPTIDIFLAPEGFNATVDPAIVAEFAHAVYRLGHSMLTESIDRLDPDFNADNLSLLQAFLNPVAFNNDGALTPEEAAGAIVRGMTRQAGNEIDEFVTDAVRNSLLGLPLDLAAINIARGRDTGVPTLNEARRQFYADTADSQLKPYESWVDLTENLKHAESAVNFIAAYGTHDALKAEDVDTVAEKRAVAMALVFGGDAVINEGTDDERIFTADDEDRIAFLNSTGEYANVGGVTTTGVDDIDLWIGGLAERQMPFGGMLGSTFGYVFENQLENLQNGDRFYYLARTAGLNFIHELEANSFAKLVMLNTDTTHLPADIFSTPAWTLEADWNHQFTGLGDDGRDDPTGGPGDPPLVIRDNPATPGQDVGYLHYTGEDHVVLGGTSGQDTLIASIGDDTLYGDEDNDRLEGGEGNDNILGGDGDDILTDEGGDDVLDGGAGNDVMHGGNGANLLFGGDGSDFIVTGEDVSETFAGKGNDFILGSKLNLPTLGNEGDDWIEIGTQDGAGGDNFDPMGLGTIKGNDVFITGPGFDEAEGEGGDDIMVMSDGEDHFAGGGGFDWGSYASDPRGVTADLFMNEFFEPPATPSTQGIKDRFAEVEGLSGSSHSDYLRGDSEAGHEGPGPLDPTLTDVGLYANLQPLLGEGVASFNGGNIILGGDGSDLLEGRGDNDILDGDRWLNVRISVRENVDGTGAEIASFQSMKDMVDDMLAGKYNPGQLQIVREILPGSGGFSFDTAVFSGNRDEYTVTEEADGSFTVAHTIDGGVTIGVDGIDTVRNIERLQFNDEAMVLVDGLNNGPAGLLEVSDTTPAVNQVLTVSALGITDADNVSEANPTGAVKSPVSYYWQAETVPGSGVFTDILIGDVARESAVGPTFQVTPDLAGLTLRVRAVYQDAHGVLENVYSDPTGAVAGSVPIATPPAPPPESPVTSPGVHFIRSDLQFILDQIEIAEAHSGAYGTPSEPLNSMIPNSRLPWGLRTVDGTYNNLVPGQSHFGAADENFPLLLDQIFRNDLDGDNFFGLTNTNYATFGPGANVVDNDPRIISNLISDQTGYNPAAVLANGGADPIMSPGMDGVFGTDDDREVFFIPNTAPDAGLSAQFNSWFTFFGQFFDHGLDLVDKGGNGSVFIPLEADDPLIKGADGILGTGDDLPVNQRFMILTRATNTAVQAGVDGVFGTSDDVHYHNNQTTPFVDQNQTYTSSASHQVFLREYALDADGHPVSTGLLLDGINGGIGNWAEVKAQAKDMLGLLLSDTDVVNVPMVAVDAYGKFIPGPNGYAQVVTNVGLVEGIEGGLDINDLPDGVTVARTGHPFLADIAHTAAPFSSSGAPLTADADDVAGGRPAAGEYDDELLDKHFITGDGRGNENIGLTTVHFIFHSEHNRLVEHIKEVVTSTNDPAFIAQWKMEDGSWNGERLFQAARYGTEMQYQHLVFEEFGRKISPNLDLFLAEGQGYEAEIDPAIVAEFAHVVYRFGHSMLTETVDRYDADFDLVNGDAQLGLIAAFLNPLEYTASGADDRDAAAAVIRGAVRQSGNEIDEFVTEALRNNLLGLPLDLPAINIARGRDTGVPTLNQARAQFFQMTGDADLKPYASWADLGANLKHAASLVNFVAAYGTHSTITSATTIEARRAAAYALVYGANGMDGLANSGDEATVAVPTDRLQFMNGPAASTGVNAIDLWIGGLAEKQMPFGGLLGSTFNFVFENQMEKLQDSDRFYYLERNANLNFLSELEGNSFARLIMANTDLRHLPANVFNTPGFTLEVDPTKQFTGIGPDKRGDPAGDVIRNNPNTPGPDTNYLKYTGDQHVVLGGTSGRDILIASEGDDSLYGDEDNDTLEGGFGNDVILGGTGDDIITDMGGDDDLRGGDGNDAIHGGNGVNLLQGGFGNDFIVTGSDEAETIAGTGNDFILGNPANEFVFGNEGDDWLEGGMADGSAGENFDSLGRDNVVGNDIFIGGGFTDRMNGEGGDDFMMGGGGQVDRYLGGSGFDWALFKHPTQGAAADMHLRAFNTAVFVPDAVAAASARFESVEGMSGSAFSDVLIGDDLDATTIPTSGARGSVLTNFALVDGLQEFVGEGVTSFSSGNIILGGGGSDILEGGGGDDLLDGDLWMNVRISIRENADGTGEEIGSADSMTELVGRVFSGEINPGQLVAVREILSSSGAPSFDTAVFSGTMAEYTIETDAETGYTTVTHNVLDGAGNVIGIGADGVDRLSNIERLQFSDQSFILDPFFENMAEGLVTIDDPTPRTGQLLTASAAGVTDPDNVSATNPTGAITGRVTYVWQVELNPGSGEFSDISLTTPAGDLRAVGPTFTPGSLESGLALRVKLLYRDANGVMEVAYSDPTAPTANSAPTGTPTISDTTPTQGQVLTARNTFVDADGLLGVVYTYQWQQSGLGGGGTFTNIAGATDATFTPGAGQVNRELRVIVSYNDAAGVPETVISPVTTVTGIAIPGDIASQTLNGTAGQDNIAGGGGADTLNGLAQNDLMDGGIGNDTMDGGAGNDTIAAGAGNDSVVAGLGNDTVNYTVGDGVDTINGGGGTDRLNYTGTTGANALTAVMAAGVITNLGSNPLSSVESIAVNLLGGTDTLTYTGATGNLQVNLGRGTATGFTSLLGVENVVTGSGNDVIVGTLGVTNSLSGGTGNDTYTVEDSTDVVIEGGAAGNDTVHSRAFSFTLGNNIENLDYIGSGHFTGTGNGSANTITGGRGSDVLSGLGGNDTVNGGVGADMLDGGAQDDLLEGGAGNDTLTGGGGNDTTNGGAGNDVFNYILGEGADVVNGGDGQDRFSVTGSTGDNLLSVVLTGGLFTSVAGMTLTSVEGAAADLLGGTDTLSFAGSADDVAVDLAAGTATGFSSIAGIENVIGGNGNDTLSGVAGAVNSLTGGNGNDTFVVHETGDLVVEAGGAGSGIDEVRSFAATYTLSNNVENLVYLGATHFRGTGNAGNNAITSGIGNDTILGGNGNDTVLGADGNDSIDGEAGDDILAGGGGNDTLIGGLSNDSLDGGLGNDSLVGGDGNDTLDGGAGVDRLIGGVGNDVLVVDSAGDVITELAAGGIDEVRSFLDAYTLANELENLTYVGAGNFSGIGNSANNVITGGGGADTLQGRNGNDALNGGSGADTLTGGLNSDTIDGGAGDDTINYVLGDGFDVVNGGADQDVFRVLGAAGANLLSVVFAGGSLGNVGGNLLTNVESVAADLLAGTDTLSYVGTTAALAVDLGAGTASGFSSIAGIEDVVGGDGNDTLAGAAGTVNRLTGGLGDDTFVVHETGDLVVEVGGGGTADAVHSFANTFTLSNNVEILVFTGTGDFVGTGTAAANTITSGDGADTLSGGNGNDTIDAGAGNDVIDAGAADDQVTGGTGDDLMDGGLGNDVFMFAAGFGQDRIAAGFDANAAGGQDKLDIRGLGITAATFGTVTITVADLDGGVGALDTLVTIGSESITLFGVNGAGANVITQDDFILA